LARVQVVNEVSEGIEGDWVLCLQWCRYLYDDGNLEQGYRFIWRRPNGTLQPARGQARIPSLDWAQRLMDRARNAGWGNQVGD